MHNRFEPYHPVCPLHTPPEPDRFRPENQFCGDFVDGKRYPFGCYTKKQVDELLDDINEHIELTDAGFEERLKALEYQQITINSFTASPTLAEMGSSVSVELAWSLNKEATAQNISGVPVTGTSYTVQNVTQSTTWQLTVSDGQTSANRTASIAFQNGVYYGVAPDLTSVTSLTKVLSGTKSRTITVNAGAGDYIVYAIPKRLGTVEFYVSGFEGGFDEPIEQSLTNASGYTETYRVYKSTNAALGETTVEVR